MSYLKTTAIQHLNASTPAITLTATGNVGIGTTTANCALDLSSRNDGIALPTGTTSTRPSSANGVMRYNSSNNAVEIYQGTRWISQSHVGSSPLNPASSAVEIYNAGIRGKGFYWMNSPNGGLVRNFCDLDTLDEDGVSGWILVAMFPTGSGWTFDGYSTKKTLDPNSMTLNIGDGRANQWRNMWSSNWGDYSMNRFRVHMGFTPHLTGSSSYADWYYHYTNACSWKQVWAWQAGNYNYMNDTTGDNNGNINAAYCSGWPTPTNAGVTRNRCCLRGFNWAYNIKFGYKNTSQRWNGLSDPSATTTSTINRDFWTGLTNSDYTLGWNVNGDGSLAILPQGSTDTTTGQDCTNQNAKVGQDDTVSATLWSSTATNNVGETGTTSTELPLFLWIK